MTKDLEAKVLELVYELVSSGYTQRIEQEDLSSEEVEGFALVVVI